MWVRNDSEPWQHTPRAPPAPLPPAAQPLNELRASDHTSDTEMEADRQSLCEVPRGLVIGEVNEMFVCGICDGLLREPRHAEFCDEHLFCRLCCEAALRKEACCPTCKQPVDESEPLQGFGPFEAMLNSTVVRCPNSNVAGGAVGGSISNMPAKSCEASGSSARSLRSAKTPGVKEGGGDGGGKTPPRVDEAGASETTPSPFDGVHVGAPSTILEQLP